MTRIESISRIRMTRGHLNKMRSQITLVEFCLPFTELKHIVEGMVDEDSTIIELEWPVSDSFLQVRIPDEPKGGNSKFKSETLLQLETYEA